MGRVAPLLFRIWLYNCDRGLGTPTIRVPVPELMEAPTSRDDDGAAVSWSWVSAGARLER
jgi:hypothetical protein